MFFWLFCIMIEEKEFIMDILGVSGMDVENVLVLFINICVNWFVVFRMKVIWVYVLVFSVIFEDILLLKNN